MQLYDNVKLVETKPSHMMYKKLVIAVFFFLLFHVSCAQVIERRGYIGIGIGPSFLTGYELGSEKVGTGLNIGLVNFGYVFAKGFGISGTWTGGAHTFNSNIDLVTVQGAELVGKFDGTVSYGALMVGPMYSLKLSHNSFIDFKARGGMFYAKESLSSGIFDSESEKTSFGYSFAISYRRKISTRWCVMLSGDYFSGEIESISSSSNGRLGAVTLNAGIGFLL